MNWSANQLQDMVILGKLQAPHVRLAPETARRAQRFTRDTVPGLEELLDWAEEFAPTVWGQRETILQHVARRGDVRVTIERVQGVE